MVKYLLKILSFLVGTSIILMVSLGFTLTSRGKRSELVVKIGKNTLATETVPTTVSSTVPSTEPSRPSLEKLIKPTLKIPIPTKKQISLPKPPNFDKWQSNICTPVYFLGGGKSGSTTVAVLLKHSPPDYKFWNSTGQFADSGKEVCWADRGSPQRYGADNYWAKFRGCSGQHSRKLFALDACPRYHTESHAKNIASVHPNAKFIMPIRDPVNRIISHANDQMIRMHGSKNINQKISTPTGLLKNLSEYYKILSIFLKYFDSENFLVVRNEALNEFTQEIVDDIMGHIGGQKQYAVPVDSNANHLANKNKYILPSNEAACLAYESFKEDVRNLKDLLGYDFKEWDRDC